MLNSKFFSSTTQSKAMQLNIQMRIIRSLITMLYAEVSDDDATHIKYLSLSAFMGTECYPKVEFLLKIPNKKFLFLLSI